MNWEERPWNWPTSTFETLVRVRRTGEGVPFTGLKPVGTPLAFAVNEADQALESGSVEKLVKLVTDEAAVRLRQRFAEAKEQKRPCRAQMWKRVVNVEYVHYAEGLHQAATGTGSHSGEGHEAGPRTTSSRQNTTIKLNLNHEPRRSYT